MRATRLRLRGGALLVAATLMSGACGTAPSPSESAPTPTPGQASPTTSPTASLTAAPTAAPTVAAPAGRWVPQLVDVPGEGVLMLSGLVPADPPATLPDMWRFEPTTGWHELATDRAPDPWGDRLLYDPETGVVWLSASGEPWEIWRLDPTANEWTQVETEGRPARVGHYVAFDSESRQFILFGGWDESDVFLNQTWAYGVDTGLWQEMDSSLGPGDRWASGMVYDANSDRVVLFGGARGGDQLGDTWTYDFNTDTWAEMGPDVSPPASSHGSMTYDSAGHRVLLFGGQIGNGPYIALADTWAYDVARDTWTEVATAAGPSARELAGMAYDAESGVVVLFGGGNVATGSGTTPDDTWLFDTTTDSWTEWTAR